MTEPFPPLKNDVLLRAARGERTDRSPVWVMRQAGRYLPEFREVRAQSDFFTVCKTPELACEVTLQPIRRYALDAAIIFCDILVIPQAMGMDVEMVPGKGPVFGKPLESPEDMSALKDVNVGESLSYVFDAISLTRRKLEGKVPLIGFCGAPWTLMAYMIEGSGSKTFSRAKTWLYKWPEAAHELLRRITAVCVEYLIAQACAGAQLLKVFDTWAGELAPDVFDEFLFPCLRDISIGVKQGLRDRGKDPPPMIVFAKGVRHCFARLAFETEYDVIALDWVTNARVAREAIESGRGESTKSVCLQGNLDPCVLYAPPEVVEREVARVVAEFDGANYPHIFNLGHGMHPTHTPEMMATFVEAVHRTSKSKR